MPQQIREIMSTEPITCPIDASVADAARAMRDADVGDVIVTENDRVRGILTDRDIAVRVVAGGDDPTQVTIGEVCSTDLEVLSPDDDVMEAVERMRQHAIRRLPVVENDRPVGIVAIGDLAIERDESSALADISAAPPNN